MNQIYCYFEGVCLLSAIFFDSSGKNIKLNDNFAANSHEDNEDHGK